MSNHGSPVALLKFQMAPHAYTLNIIRLQKQGAQMHMPERDQGLTFTKNASRGFLFHSTLPTQWTAQQP